MTVNQITHADIQSVLDIDHLWLAFAPLMRIVGNPASADIAAVHFSQYSNPLQVWAKANPAERETMIREWLKTEEINQ